MPRATNGASRSTPDRSTPRRSALTQARSQETRRKLIRAALDLWNERGFDEAFEETTAEEIARAAGVSKGTFWFHFAHKEDILLEMPWATAEAMADEARTAMARGEPTFDLMEQLMTSLARRMSRAPRAALLRVTAHWSRLLHVEAEPGRARGFGEVFEAVIGYARERGDLPPYVEVPEVASLLQAVTMDALVGWATTSQSASDLRRTLCRRVELVLLGAAVSYRR